MPSSKDSLHANSKLSPTGDLPKPLRIGTCAFTANGWNGMFYPKGLPSSENLAYYSQHFDTVELDTTLYGPPSIATVKNWYSKTPKGFIFAAKFPQTITHKKVLR